MVDSQPVASRSPSQTSSKRSSSFTHMMRTLGRWAFIAPLLIVNLVVIIIPSISGLLYSLTEWNGIGESTFVGLANFRALLDDKVLLIAFQNNLLYTGYFLIVPIAVGLLGAYLLSGVTRGQMVYRLLFFIPYILATVINAQIWRYLLHPKFGIGASLAEVGITFLDFAVFGRRETAIFGVMFVDSWHWWGFLVVIYLAAMGQVDTELYEVGYLDGATRWQQFWYVTLPLIRPTLIFTLLIIFIGSTLVFDHVYILTGGGPAHASEVMSTHLYGKAFESFEVGYGAAIGVVLAFWVSVPLCIFYYLRRRGWEI